MVSDVFLPKLLDGYPVTFVRAEGLNDFVVRVNSEKERTISRERQIVRIMAEGLTNKEMALRLGLAAGTVKVHLHRIYRKLGIANRTALAILAHTNFAEHVH